ncbi:MAG: clostripain-related cysteine peptidase [Rikenellaceae bacterium]|nr:clostripain-related cysteine peptidase [Rikenellaceae bacterium]
MKKILALLLCLPVAAATLVSCKKDPAPQPPLGKKHRTVIEYMVADNNLYSYAEDDINEMEAAWSDNYYGHMVVYLYPVASSSSYAPSRKDYNEKPRLLLVSRDNNTQVMSSRVLKTYGREQDPTDPAVMKQVIADAMELAPADNYALVMWSHGSGWLPKGLGQPLKSMLPPAGDPAWAGSKLEGMAPETPDGGIAYSFGQSNSHGNNEMEIDEMAAALPTGTVFDFILFDACHMACVEVAWELRDRTEYLIASAAETLADGFPYTEIMGSMFAPQADVEGIARKFFDHYNTMSGQWRSATVGVVRSSELPGLASAVKALCDAGLPASGISYAGQQYGRTATYFNNTFYDLRDFAEKTWGAADPKVTALQAALDKAVVYQAATPWLFSQLQVTAHCGLSCYLPRNSTPLSLAAYRTRFGWSTASGMGSLVP